MNALWSVKEIKRVIGEDVIGPVDDSEQIGSVSYYHTQSKPGGMHFVTYRDSWGKKYKDQIGLLSKLAKRGVKLAVVQPGKFVVPNGMSVIRVESTRKALVQLGRASRKRFQGKVIGVTGSAGKTTTKSMIHQLLQGQGTAFGSKRNYNHRSGVALSLAQTPADYDFGVYEFAVDSPKRTLPKARLLRPDVAVFTAIEPDHLHYYHSMEGVTRQKLLLTDPMPENGVVVANADTNCFELIRDHAKARELELVTFGIEDANDVVLKGMDLMPTGSLVDVSVAGKRYEYRLRQAGSHNVRNSMAALAAVHALGGDVALATHGLAHLEKLPSRVEELTLDRRDGQVNVVRDTYSSNPASVRAGLEYFGLFSAPRGGRRIMVLSDIKELGEQSSTLHADLAPAVKQAGIDRLYTFGEDSSRLTSVARDFCYAEHHTSVESLTDSLESQLRHGDLVYVKGSMRSGEAMEQIMAAIGGV